MRKGLIIRGLSTISPLGASDDEVRQSLVESACRAAPLADRGGVPVFPLTKMGEGEVQAMADHEAFSRLDRAVQIGLIAAKKTLSVVGDECSDIGCVSIGSSRGATRTLERTITEFNVDNSRVPVETSPTTTAGNITSWVAQLCEDAKQKRGPASVAGNVGIDTSMTCSSSLHALLISLAFIKSGMASAALFGGAEACLTPYTVAHLEALRLYGDWSSEWVCRPGGSVVTPRNSVVLGEGAGTAVLRWNDGTRTAGDLSLLGVGWAIERIPSATGLSRDGNAMEAAMRMAIAELPQGRRVDAVVVHAPGSVRGDEAEWSAVSRVLGEGVMVCSTKHLTGHTYGASGMVSLALAQQLLGGVMWDGFPYDSIFSDFKTARPETVLINTAGFGGNAVTVVVGKP